MKTWIQKHLENCFVQKISPKFQTASLLVKCFQAQNNHTKIKLKSKHGNDRKLLSNAIYKWICRPSECTVFQVPGDASELLWEEPVLSSLFLSVAGTCFKPPEPLHSQGPGSDSQHTCSILTHCASP